jgi:hypothetical protein
MILASKVAAPPGGRGGTRSLSGKASFLQHFLCVFKFNRGGRGLEGFIEGALQCRTRNFTKRRAVLLLVPIHMCVRAVCVSVCPERKQHIFTPNERTRYQAHLHRSGIAHMHA